MHKVRDLGGVYVDFNTTEDCGDLAGNGDRSGRRVQLDRARRKRFVAGVVEIVS